MCNISVATSTKRKDKTSGEMVEETQWHRVQFFDKLAEIAGEYLRKGKPVYVEGRLKYGKYTDKDGVERNTTDIVAETMQMLGGRDGGGSSMGDEGGGAPAPRQAAAPRAPAAPMARQNTAASSAGGGRGGSATGFDDMDDDIPF
jgi:single-strand DNA-binding protein